MHCTLWIPSNVFYNSQGYKITRKKENILDMKLEGSTKSKSMLTKIGKNLIRDYNNDGLI